ncbi:MAG: DUF2332 family protein [Oricola sp.]
MEDLVPLPPHIAAAFRSQEQSCRTLGSLFTAAICGLVADHGVPAGPVHDRLSGWTGKIDSAGDALPLRLTGALHNLVLSGRDSALTDVYPPNPADEGAFADAIAGAMVRHGDAVDRFLDNAPQTNETARSAVLLPAFLHLGEKFGLPLVLSELGSSAGLNQNWPLYRYEYGAWGWGDLSSPVTLACEWYGDKPPAPRSVRVARGAGCDIAPISIDDAAQRLRLKSYIWPDQPSRLVRLSGALAIADEHPPTVEKASAADWLERRLDDRLPGQLHVVFHTIMWQYIPAEEQGRAQSIIERAGRKATADAPLAWLRFETDGGSDGAPIVLTTWEGKSPEGETVTLGRGDFHGRWLRWQPPA